MAKNAMKILSVDDEQDLSLLMKQMFRKEIKAGEYEFYFATHGVEALEILAKHPDISIILADINMPVMDGLTLLKKVKEKMNPLMHIIMVSAYGDMKNIRISMNNGAFDFVTKPIDFGDLRITLEKTRKEIDFIKQKLKQGKKLKVLEADLEAGALIQNALLPKIQGQLTHFPSINIFTHYLPAKEVSGDFYDVFPLDDHRLGFLIADVSGKGIPAAAFMLICHTAIKVYSREGDSPSKVLQRANNYLNIGNDESMFVTAFFAILNTNTNVLTYSFAGHNRPFLIQSNEVKELSSQQNIALGILDNHKFTEGNLQLSVGDKVVMFTDGVTEPIDEKGDDFGEDRLKGILENDKDHSIIEIGNTIISEIEIFTQGLPQFDDITLVAFEINKL